VSNDDLSERDTAFIDRAKVVLDQRVLDLDRETVLRLQRARVDALSGETTRRWIWAWTSTVAIGVVAVLAVVLWMKQPSQENHHSPVFEDMELMMSAENVELAEDFEFYHWLADADTTG